MATPVEMKTAHSLLERKRTTDVISSENINIDFASLLLSENVQKGLTSAGFEKPSPIQLQAIPLGRCGLDLIVQAKSGTGKTCVFSVIALENVIVTSSSLQVLVLAPTREIAVQIHSVIQAIGSAMEALKCHTFIGGTIFGQDRQSLKKCHIAVGTPGRIKQLIEYEVMKTDSIRLFILDEADKLLDEKFQADVNWIYHQLPENKQMLALSATYPEYLAQQLTNYMRDPTFVRLNPKDLVLQGIKQFYQIVPGHELPHKAFQIKAEQLVILLSQVAFNQCLIFSNLQSRAQNLCDLLLEKGWPASFISGNQEQTDRMKAMMELKTYKCRILVSTDLTARGIDAMNVNLIVNLDVPTDFKTYLHRIGRAGRFGTHGAAVSLASEGQEVALLKIVQKRSGSDIRALPDPIPSNLLEMSASDVNTTNLQSVEVEASVSDDLPGRRGGGRKMTGTESGLRREQSSEKLTGAMPRNLTPKLNVTNGQDTHRSNGTSGDSRARYTEALPDEHKIQECGVDGNEATTSSQRKSGDGLTGTITSLNTKGISHTNSNKGSLDTSGSSDHGRKEQSLELHHSGATAKHQINSDPNKPRANEYQSNRRSDGNVAPPIETCRNGHVSEQSLFDSQVHGNIPGEGEETSLENGRMQGLHKGHEATKDKGLLALIGLNPDDWIVPLAVVQEVKKRPRKRWTFEEALNLFDGEAAVNQESSNGRVNEQCLRPDPGCTAAGISVEDDSTGSLPELKRREHLVNDSSLKSEMVASKAAHNHASHDVTVDDKESCPDVIGATGSHGMQERPSPDRCNFEENYKCFENHDIFAELGAIRALSERVRAEIVDAQNDSKEQEETSQSENSATLNGSETLPKGDDQSMNHRSRTLPTRDASSANHRTGQSLGDHHSPIEVEKSGHGLGGGRQHLRQQNGITLKQAAVGIGGNVRSSKRDEILQIPERSSSEMLGTDSGTGNSGNSGGRNGHVKTEETQLDATIAMLSDGLNTSEQKLSKNDQDFPRNGQDPLKKGKKLSKQEKKVFAPIVAPSIEEGKNYDQCTPDDLPFYETGNDGRTSDKTWEYFKFCAYRETSLKADEVVDSPEDHDEQVKSTDSVEGALMKNRGAMGSLTTLDMCSVYSNKSNATSPSNTMRRQLAKTFDPSAGGRQGNARETDSMEAGELPLSDQCMSSNKSSFRGASSTGIIESLEEGECSSSDVPSASLDPGKFQNKVHEIGAEGRYHKNRSGYGEPDWRGGWVEPAERNLQYPASYVPDESGDGRGVYWDHQGRSPYSDVGGWSAYHSPQAHAASYNYGYPYYYNRLGSPYNQYW